MSFEKGFVDVCYLVFCFFRMEVTVSWWIFSCLAVVRVPASSAAQAKTFFTNLWFPCVIGVFCVECFFTIIAKVE